MFICLSKHFKKTEKQREYKSCLQDNFMSVIFLRLLANLQWLTLASFVSLDQCKPASVRIHCALTFTMRRRTSHVMHKTF